jgi:hypothetical protein
MVDWRRALKAPFIVVILLLERPCTTLLYNYWLHLTMINCWRQWLQLRELACRLWARVTWWLTLSPLSTRKFSVRSTRTTRNRLKPVAVLSRFLFSERYAANICTYLLEQSGATTAWDTVLHIAFVEETMFICQRLFLHVKEVVCNILTEQWTYCKS